MKYYIILLLFVIFIILTKTYRNEYFQVPHTKVTLLMRSYNRPDYLERCLNSLTKSDMNLCYKRNS